MDSTRTPGFVACSTVPDTYALAHCVASTLDASGYVVTVRANDVKFRRFTDISNLEAEVSLWEEGRVFSRVAELRWKRTAHGGFVLLLLTEDKQRVSPSWDAIGAEWSAVSHDGEESMRLWGERKEKSSSLFWIETRIPRILEYPVAETTETVQVGWVEYRDSQDSPRLMRLKEVGDASR